MEMSIQPHGPAALAPAKLQGGWVSPRTGLDVLEERKIPCFCENRIPDRPVRSPVSVTAARISVKCIVNKWFVKVETGFRYFRYGPATTNCEHGEC